MKKIFLLLILCIHPVYSQQRMYLEKEYQDYWCKANNGKAEYVLSDKTRVDCLTEKYAVEFDFANKVYEGIGQAFYYSSQTGKTPAVILIVENPLRDQKYITRLQSVCTINKMHCETITPKLIGK